jgi:hypothetical protein
VRAPGSKVTLAPVTRAGSGAWNSGSIRTVPVNQSAGPLFELCDPALFISILLSQLSTLNYQLSVEPLRLISIYQSDRSLSTLNHQLSTPADHGRPLTTDI